MEINCNVTHDGLIILWRYSKMTVQVYGEGNLFGAKLMKENSSEKCSSFTMGRNYGVLLL